MRESVYSIVNGAVIPQASTTGWRDVNGKRTTAARAPWRALDRLLRRYSVTPTTDEAADAADVVTDGSAALVASHDRALETLIRSARIEGATQRRPRRFRAVAYGERADLLVLRITPLGTRAVWLKCAHDASEGWIATEAAESFVTRAFGALTAIRRGSFVGEAMAIIERAATDFTRDGDPPQGGLEGEVIKDDAGRPVYRAGASLSAERPEVVDTRCKATVIGAGIILGGGSGLGIAKLTKGGVPTGGAVGALFGALGGMSVAAQLCKDPAGYRDGVDLTGSTSGSGTKKKSSTGSASSGSNGSSAPTNTTSTTSTPKDDRPDVEHGSTVYECAWDDSKGWGATLVCVPHKSDTPNPDGSMTGLPFSPFDVRPLIEMLNQGWKTPTSDAPEHDPTSPTGEVDVTDFTVPVDTARDPNPEDTTVRATLVVGPEFISALVVANDPRSDPPDDDSGPVVVEQPITPPSDPAANVATLGIGTAAGREFAVTTVERVGARLQFVAITQRR
jgi:hypothetical protein